MKYIKKFKTDSDFQTFKGSKDYVTPNISHIVETENNTLRKNIKFTIDGKEYNVGKHMTWEEWIGHDNHAHYNNGFYSIENGNVVNKESLNVCKEETDIETYNETIISNHDYIISINELKTLYYTSSDGNIVVPNSENLTGVTILSNTYENNIGCITFNNQIQEIPNNFFKTCTTLTNIEIPNGISKIGSYAFDGCSGLTGELVIPDSVTSIESYAFQGCSGLTGELVIPDSVTSIGSSAFQGCSGFTSLRLSKALTKLSWYNFADCTGLTKVEIPTSIQSLKTSVFSNCTNLTRVDITDLAAWCNIDMESSACPLYYAKNLYLNGKLISGELVIPEGVTKIGGYAFYGCKEITSVVLPESLTSIGPGAFYGCSGITNITIPSNVRTISNTAFDNCTNLQFINIVNLSAWCELSEGTASNICNLTNNRKLYLNGELISGELVIPEGVTKIGGYAFYNCKEITNVVLPESLTSIGPGAFHGCSGLTSITIPNNVQSIGGYAFAYSDKLSTITLPTNLTSINGEAFACCNGLISFTIPSSVKSIGSRAFRNCANLTNITINNGVEYIYSQAFRGCPKLIELRIPDSVKVIDNGMCWQCQNLTTVYIGTGVENISFDVFYKCNNLTKVQIQSVPVPSIDDSTYIFPKNTIIYVPNNLVEQYKNKWVNYSNQIQGNGTEYTTTTTIHYTTSDASLLDIPNIDIIRNEYNDGIGVIEFWGTLKTIRDNMFKDNTLLTSITIPDSVTSIGNNAFSGCSSLTHITLPNNVTSIGNNAFSGCSSLTGELVIPDSVTSIESYAFSGCSSLTKITIPDNIKQINGSTFSGCTNLLSINIPSSVTYIDNGAFGTCNALNRVDITDLAAWCQLDIYHTNSATSAAPLYYAKNLYLNGELISGELVIPEGVTKIGFCAFCGCKEITSVVLPESLTSIDGFAFYGCSGLTSIKLPDNVTQLGGAAFLECTGLTSVSFGKKPITSNGGGKYLSSSCVFEGCTNLTRVDITDLAAWCQTSFFGGVNGYWDASPLSHAKNLYLNGELISGELVIPEGVTKIGETIFAKYDKITSVVIPNSVTSIGGGAFGYCSNITHVSLPDSINSISNRAFQGCTKWVGDLQIPSKLKIIPYCGFSNCNSLTSVIIPDSVTSIGNSALSCSNVKTITVQSKIPPTIEPSAFQSIASKGVIIHPVGSDYNSWLTSYLSNWETKEMYDINSYFGLQITADNVKGGRQTKTTVHWTCGLDGTSWGDNLPVVKQISGTGISNEFPQNLSETESVQREVVFEYQGMTAKTTITQGPWSAVGYNVVLNDNWEKSTTIYNPDETLYDGVYQSFSNKGVPSTAAVMYIDIDGYENFKFYIRSYGESGYDYVMVSQLDTDIDNNTSYSNTNLVKAHTRSKSTSGTVISNYTLVEFTGMDCGHHRITIVYRKDGSGDSYDDRGYVLIPYEQEG